MSGLSIKGWEEFQHYKTGKNAAKRPEWIRLYTKLLDDIEFYSLSGDDAKLLFMLWMLASERDGALPDTKDIAFRFRLQEDAVKASISRLSHWVLGLSYDIPRTEKKREEEKREEKKGGACAPSLVVFSGSYVLTVTEKNLTTWGEVYFTLDRDDMLAELSLCDEFHSGNPTRPDNWFFTASAWLKRVHDRRLKARRAEDEREAAIYRGAI